MGGELIPEAWGTHGAVRMRAAPVMPPGAYRSFSIAAPIATHFRPATCAEVRCGHHEHGWTTTVDTAGPQAYYIRRESGRKFTEEALSPSVVRFTFEPGQRCFGSADHKLRVERPEIYIARAGDWRASDGDAYRHAGSADWVDEFAGYQDKLATAVSRG